MINSERIQILDGWRGVAVCMVLFGHFVPLPGSEVARLGVELFFVLSGRLMAQILIVKKTALPIFFWRRLSRIFPALIIFVVVVILLSTFGRFAPSPLEYFSVLTMWSNYLFTFTPREPVFGHTWSLAIEEHSYIALGFIAFLTARNVKLSLIFAAAVIIIGFSRGIWLSFSSEMGFYEIYWRTDVRAASLFCGFFAYLYHLNYGLVPAKLVTTKSNRVIIIAMAVIVLQFASVIPDTIKYTIGTVMVAVLLIILEGRAAQHGSKDQIVRMMTHRLIVLLGITSYSTYLYQQVFHVFKTDYPIYTAPLFLIPSLVMGWLSWRYVETPSREFLNAVSLPFTNRSKF